MNIKRLAIAVVAIGSLAGSAFAGTVDVDFVGVGLGCNVRIHLGSSAFNAFSGQLRHNFSNGNGSGVTLEGDYLTYCTEIVQYVVSGVDEYQIVPVEQAPGSGPMGAVKAQAVRDIYDYADGAQFASQSTADNKDLASAFQIAVWEIVYDYDGSSGSLDVIDGNLRLTQMNGSPLPSGVAGHLADLFAAIGSNAAMPGLFAVTNDAYQDQLVLVPLPASLALGALGLAGVIARRRLRVHVREPTKVRNHP